jgi:hypothetical protein
MVSVAPPEELLAEESHKPVEQHRAKQSAAALTKSAIPVMTEKQRAILKALDGKALTLEDLALQLDCDKSRLHRDHLKPLTDRDVVRNSRRIGGYYRPDAPPTMA